MLRTSIIDTIRQLTHQENAFERLEKAFAKINRKTLSKNIIECGIIPEMFSAGSSEEKLWSKLSDIMLAAALSQLGIKTRVLGARGNAADVYGESKKYTIVADSKTFRLSRTAKNQKDFKIQALSSWRIESSYALLVAPLSQFPTKSSQIYVQAINLNVTLLSYTHLNFLLDFYKNENLKPLWETGSTIKKLQPGNSHSDSKLYWQQIDETICHILNKNLDSLKKYKLLELEKTKEIGNEGINYWNEKIKEYSNLSKSEAIKKLIKAEKIHSKIKLIQQTIYMGYELV